MEVLSLLQSTYPQHKIFALRIIHNILKGTNDKAGQDFTYKYVLNTQKTSLLTILISCGNVSRFDFINILVEIWHSIFSRVLGGAYQ